MTRRKLSFAILLLVASSIAFSCNDGSSSGGSGTLSGTWIIEKSQMYSNIVAYAPPYNPYAKYKYLNLNPGGKGLLWGGNSALDGQATWNEPLKMVELEAKDSSGVFLNFEKYEVDSLSAYYLHLTHISYHHDSVLTHELFLKK